MSNKYFLRYKISFRLCSIFIRHTFITYTGFIIPSPKKLFGYFFLKNTTEFLSLNICKNFQRHLQEIFFLHFFDMKLFISKIQEIYEIGLTILRLSKIKNQKFILWLTIYYRKFFFSKFGFFSFKKLSTYLFFLLQTLI